LAKKAKREARRKTSTKRINNVHVLQGDEAEEVGDPGAVDVELREDSRKREVEELIEEEVEEEEEEEEEAELMTGVEDVKGVLKFQEVVGEVVEVEGWCQRRMLSKDKLGLTNKYR